MKRATLQKAIACSFLAAVLFAAAPAAAQGTLVVPPANTSVEGNSLERTLGTDQIRHIQFVHTSLVKTAIRKSIKEIRYRRDGNVNMVNGVKIEPMTRKPARTNIPIPTWQVLISNYNGNTVEVPLTYPLTGAGLYQFKRVFRAKLNIGPTPGPSANTPNLALPTSGLPAFQVRFPFSQPFFFTGPHLAVQHFSNASRNYAYHYYMDAVWSTPTGYGKVELISKTSLGCPAGQNRVYGVVPGPGGGNAELYLFGAPNNAVCAATFGATSQTTNLGFMGLPSCNLYTDLLVFVFTKTNLAGYAELKGLMPLIPSLANATILHQWFVVDPRVNPITNLATSDGMKVTVGSKVGSPLLPMSTLSGEGNYANNRIGFINRNTGMVFQLVW